MLESLSLVSEYRLIEVDSHKTFSVKGEHSIPKCLSVHIYWYKMFAFILVKGEYVAYSFN